MTTYQPPGVYVESTTPSLVAPGSVPATTVTIVGEARGYQVASEVIALSLTPVALSNKGVLPDANPAPNLVVTRLDGTVLAETTDYVLNRASGLPTDATTVALSGTSIYTAGTLVRVSYAYTDADYFASKTFQDFTSVENTYGPAMTNVMPLDPNASQVASPLTLAARIAFENGASSVICVAIEPVTDAYPLATRFIQAYAKLSGDPSVTLVVPVFAQGAAQSDSSYTASLQTLISAIRTHCDSEASNGYGRIAFVGADTGYDNTGANPDYNEIASTTGSRRVVLAYPNRMTYYNTLLNQRTEIGGPYLAAAYAGRLSAQLMARGLTRLQVFSFSGIPSDIAASMDITSKNVFSAAGVCVTEVGNDASLRIRHGVSTDMSDVLSSEVSITRAQDALYRLLNDGVENAELIGEPIDSDMPMRVKGILTGILESAVTDSVIAEWIDLQVRQQDPPPAGNPTVIEALFTYRPFLPMNYVSVAFSIDLTTGTTTATDVVA